jgi:RNA-directed DNA polymerase
MPKAVEAGWSTIEWDKIRTKVSKLQGKIYQASLEGDKVTVVKYQKTLIQSYAARLLAVRRVTQDNRGKKTAGVDKVKILNDTKRMELAESLKLDGKASPLKRIEIPKKDGSKRPLGIPTMEDRAKQALAKLALEPEWEALFEPNSYGFRPGRSCHDAIEAIELAVRRKTKYVLDADIKGCFDNIDHNRLLEKLKTFPLMEKQIKAWLKSGVLKGDVFFRTEKGTPQGGVISPLLANIALHGMERFISDQFPKRKTRIGMPKGKMRESCEPRVIRYADDFVIIHEDQETILKCKEEIENWLKGIGLILSPTKTKLTHTKDSINGNEPGFDFLGFNIRTYDVGKYKSNTKCNGEKLMMVTKVKPSEKSIKSFIQKVEDILDSGHDKAPVLMIQRLNWLFRGWGNYFKTASHLWEEVGSIMSQLNKIYLNWGKKRFSKEGIGYISRKIFHKGRYSKWTFGWKAGDILFLTVTLYEFPYEKYVKVKDTRTPYDGDWLYWCKRRGEHPEAPADLKRGIKTQKGLCWHCGQHFDVEDQIEIHHKDGNRKNNRVENKVLVHNYCHDEIHRERKRVEPVNKATIQCNLEP